MPITIPTIDAPFAQTRPLPTPYAPADGPRTSIASTLGDGLLHLAPAAAQAISNWQEAADEAAANEKLNTLRSKVQEHLDFLKSQEGFNAAATSSEVYRSLNQTSEELYGSLANDRQRAYFAKHGQNELSQALRVGEAHVRDQTDSAENASFRVANEGDIDFATRYGVSDPGIVARRAESIEQRFDRMGRLKGMKPEDVTVLRDRELGKLYMAQVRAQIARSNFSDAQSILDVHEGKMGEEGQLLRLKVEDAQRHARADATGAELLKATKPADATTYDENAALDAADAKFPPGAERQAVREYIKERAATQRAGRQATESQNWNRALLAYQAQSTSPASRSVALLRTDHPDVWADLTGAQRSALEEQERADRRAKEGEPLSKAQELALASLENDIIDRPDYWAAEPESTLQNDTRYSSLPERFRLQMMAKAAETKRDRFNPQGVVQSADAIMRSYAQSTGILGSGTKGKPFDKWSEDDQATYTALRGEVGSAIVSWYRDNANKGKSIPPEVVKAYVDEAHRTGKLKGTGWFFEDSAMRRDAAARPQSEQSAHPFVPDVSDDEKTIGRDVQLRRGKNPTNNPEAFTPEALIRARADWAEAQKGPPAAKLAQYKRDAAAAGRVVEGPEAERVFRMIWEREHLGYAR